MHEPSCRKFSTKHLLILETSVVAKKVFNDWLKERPSKEFNRIQCIIKTDEFPYLRIIKYTCLKSLHVFSLKRLMEESKSSTFPDQCLYKVLHERMAYSGTLVSHLSKLDRHSSQNLWFWVWQNHMPANVTEPISMFLLLPTHFYTYLDLKIKIKIIIEGYPHLGFANKRP